MCENVKSREGQRICFADAAAPQLSLLLTLPERAFEGILFYAICSALRFYTAKTHNGSGPLGNDASSRVRPSHPYLADIERSFGGSDAPRVDTPVRGDVLDLAARSADIH